MYSQSNFSGVIEVVRDSFALPNGMELPPFRDAGNDYAGIIDGHDSLDVNGVEVSIVIPHFNRIEMLRRTLAMLTHSNHPLNRMEIIIVDDGSTDPPLEMIPEFNQWFEIILVIQEDQGYRLSEARNLGIRTASHDHIIILDCDMAPVPDLVPRMLRLLACDPRVIVCGHRRYVDANQVAVDEVLGDPTVMTNLPDIETANPIMAGASASDWREGMYSKTNELLEEPYPFRAFCGGNVGFSQSLIDSIGGFDVEFNAWGAEDTEFGFRAWNAGYYFVPDRLAIGLHQEPVGGRGDVDREAGRAITLPMLEERCPANYRKYEQGRTYLVPKISVYIPCYNAEATIIEAVDSALEQTYTDLEVVICDDGSTDGSVDVILARYASEPRVQLIQQANGGIGSASNAAIRRCRGMFIVHLDSDDRLMPTAVETLLPIIERDRSLTCVYGMYERIDHSGEFLKKGWFVPTFSRERLLHGMIVHPMRMFRRRDWARVGGFNEEMRNAVDFDFYLRLSEVGDLRAVHHLSYQYRHLETSTSNAESQEQVANTHRAIRNSLVRMGLAKDWSFTQTDPKNPKVIEFLPSGDAEEPKPINSILPEPPSQRKERPRPALHASTPSHVSRWSQNGRHVVLKSIGHEISFRMPIGFDIRDVHHDLLMIAEYVTTQPWNKNLLNGWKGTRSKGWRPGLAFSGGFDSTAAMLLMPPHTALCYHKRVNVQGSLDHTNADHMIAEIAKHQGRIVTVVESDHESVRASLGSGTGFATDFSPAAALILLADHLGLDSIALGLPLENSFFFHGHRPRDFLNSGYWNLYSNLFSSIGLDLFYPTGGCSEIVNIEIVKASGLQHLAQSCLRSNEVGSGCGKCWKCFRKNSMLGRKVEFSNEVTTFLKKRPLKQAISTLYAVQRLPNRSRRKAIEIGGLAGVIDMDLSYLNKYVNLDGALVPKRYRDAFQAMLAEYTEMMSEEEFEAMMKIDLTDL